jgi:hypothetical protein
MSDDDEKLTRADPRDFEIAIGMTLSEGARKRLRGEVEVMARVVAERIVQSLERSGFVIMRKPPRETGASPLGRGPSGR